MTYRVHKFVINMDEDRGKLEDFLNELEGEVITIIPNVRATSLSQIAGTANKIDYLRTVRYELATDEQAAASARLAGSGRATRTRRAKP